MRTHRINDEKAHRGTGVLQAQRLFLKTRGFAVLGDHGFCAFQGDGCGLAGQP